MRGRVLSLARQVLAAPRPGVPGAGEHAIAGKLGALSGLRPSSGSLSSPTHSGSSAKAFFPSKYLRGSVSPPDCSVTGFKHAVERETYSAVGGSREAAVTTRGGHGLGGGFFSVREFSQERTCPISVSIHKRPLTGSSFQFQQLQSSLEAPAVPASIFENDVIPDAKRRKKGLFDLLWRRPDWGVGAKVAKRHWKQGVFYQLTRVRPKGHRSGQAWGVFHNDGVPTSEELKIGGVHKPCWKFVQEGALGRQPVVDGPPASTDRGT